MRSFASLPSRAFFLPLIFRGHRVTGSILSRCSSPLLLPVFPALLLVLSCAGVFADAASQRQFADGLYSRGLHELALTEYEALLGESPDFSGRDAVLFRRAECFRELGKKRFAEEAYRRVLREHPGSPYRFRAEFRRAELFLAGQQYEKAESLFAALVASNPPSGVMASSTYFLGYARDRLGKAVEAEDSYREVVDRHADSSYFAYASLALAQLCFAGNGRDAEAVELLRALQKESPTDRVAAEALFLLADAAYRADNYSESASLYQLLMERFPDDRRATESKLQAAWSLYREGKHADALEMARDATEGVDGPLSADWLYLRANAERKTGEKRASIGTYDRLLGAFPANRVSAGAAYEQLLLFFGEGEYEKISERGPQLVPAPDVREDYLWLMAESFAQLNRDEDALQAFESLASEFPDTDRAAAAIFRQARILQTGKDAAAAVLLYEEVADRFPSSELAAEALYTAGSCRLGKQQLEKAIGNWSRLKERYPDFERGDDAQFQKGLAEMKLGKNQAAESTFLGLIGDTPGSPRVANALYWCAVISDNRGDSSESEQRLRSALEKGPDELLEGTLRYRLAAVLQKQERFDEAASLLQSLLECSIAAEMSNSLLEWLARFRINRKEAAQAEAAASLLASRETSPDWRQIALYLQGEALALGGHTGKAHEAFAAVVVVEAGTKEKVLAAERLGDLSLAEGRLERAERYYGMAAELASASELPAIQARSYFGLGRVAEAGKDWPEAARRYLSVGILFDNAELTPEAMYLSARNLEKAGKSRERKKVAQELLERYPGSEWAAKLKEDEAR